MPGSRLKEDDEGSGPDHSSPEPVGSLDTPISFSPSSSDGGGDGDDDGGGDGGGVVGDPGSRKWTTNSPGPAGAKTRDRVV